MERSYYIGRSVAMVSMGPTIPLSSLFFFCWVKMKDSELQLIEGAIKWKASEFLTHFFERLYTTYKKKLSSPHQHQGMNWGLTLRLKYNLTI